MRFLMLVYADEALLGKVQPQEFDAEMRQCLEHADAMQACGKLLSYQQLEGAGTARSVRVRDRRTPILEAPFDRRLSICRLHVGRAVDAAEVLFGGNTGAGTQALPQPLESRSCSSSPSAPRSRC